jgi:myo-inositol-1-phosphate synthase
MVWFNRVYFEGSEIHETLAAFEQALKDDDKRIAPSMIYAYAALKLGVPFSNGAPNLTVDIPAMIELAKLTQNTNCR